MAEVLLHDIDDRGVARLTLHRPARHNALDRALVEALIDRLGKLAADPQCRLLVLTGSGESFCSGADLREMQQVVGQGEAANLADATRLAALMRLLFHFPRPTLARVNGPAYGGGIGLVACCDVAVAVSGACFAFSEVRLGLVPAVIAPYVIRAIGVRACRELMLTAERFDAADAKRHGLLHRCVDGAGLDAATADLVAALLRGEPGAQAQTRRLLDRLSEPDPGVVVETAALTARIRAGGAARDRVAAFLARNAPARGGGRE